MSMTPAPQELKKPMSYFQFLFKYRDIFLYIVIAGLIPFLITNPFYQQIIMLIYLYAGLGIAWNLLGGYAGQLSLGHSAFFGLGAYAYSLSVDQVGIGFALFLSLLIPLLFAIPAGWITFRLRGPYFTLGTIAFGELLRILATDQLKDFTQGSAGLIVTSIAPNPGDYYYLMMFFFIFAFVIVRSIVDSKTGYYLMAIREDEDTAQTITINTTWYKIIALMVSGAITGLGGALYASLLGTIEPEPVFGHIVSNQVVFLVVLGGVATMWGPMLGAILLLISSEFLKIYLGTLNLPFLSDPNSFAFFLYGLLIVVIVLFAPDGIIGLMKRLGRRKKR